MATDVQYTPERAGDWGAPAPAAGSTYGDDTLRLHDNTPLYFRYWRHADPLAPVLVWVHGLGAHTGWFIDLGNALNARGLSVYMADHRGFGRSAGPRGHVRRGRTYVDDLSQFIAEVRDRQPGAPVFVLGHSMGAIFAVHLAADDAASARNRLAGLLLLNPWVRDQTKVSPVMTAGVLVGGLFGSDHIWNLAGGPDHMTANPQAREMLNADPYWVRGESSSFLYQITLLRSAMLKRARQVRVPALVLQSDTDLSIVPAASRQCFDALGSPDKTWKTYPGYYHDAEFERDRSALDDDIADWILRHRA